MQIIKAVYYKFKSAKDYDAISIDDSYISVHNFKAKIFESKKLFGGSDFDLIVTNALTSEEYTDEAKLIPARTSVLIRRVPRPCMPITIKQVIEPDKPNMENKSEDVQPVKSNLVGTDSSVMRCPENSEWDDFGDDLYAIPEVLPVPLVQCNNPIQDAPTLPNDDEDKRIKALVDTPALDWQHQASDGFVPGRGFGRDMGRRMRGAYSSGRVLEQKTPPQGYICHRCKVPGHFIQHCPTNGDPNFDIKRVKPPTGIPRFMLMETPDGSYALPSGAVAVLKPNEAAFEKEIEGMSSSRSTSIVSLPPELHCPLCKDVMKDAVLTSKCCFRSFCDKCIRDHICSKSTCVCGATNILADDLLPNKTLRNTINRILESDNSSSENASSARDMKPALCPQPKIPSPMLSASKGEQVPLPQNDKEAHQRPVSGEAGKKKNNKKTCLPFNATEMQWGTCQDLAVENYIMFDHSAYNLFWTGIQAGMEGFVAPYTVDSMGYGFSPLDVPFRGVLSPDSFGAQGYMLPLAPPQRDLSKAGEFSGEVSSGLDVPSLKSKSKTISHTSQADHRSSCRPGDAPPGTARPPSATPELPPKSTTRTARADHRMNFAKEEISVPKKRKLPELPPKSTTRITRADHRISFAEEEPFVSKKRKLLSDHHPRKSSGFASLDYASSRDDERHFKRRWSRGSRE